MDITEQQKRDFLKYKCFYCEAQMATITEESCLKYQDVALKSNDYNPAVKCRECHRFELAGKKVETKLCKLHKEYPGFCTGVGKFARRSNMSNKQFSDKLFCRPECGNRYYHFKRLGYEKSEDVKGRVKKKFRPEMVGEVA